ncbi:MAG: CBS domain-containing protein [Actinomycetota bacterium]|nr:CBS domain-containing protein [Actinomycetota bacterium]
MRISEIMTKAAVNDSADDSVAEASRKMHEQQTGSLLVMDGKSLIGIITERDILKVVARGLDPNTTPIKEVMTTDVVTIEPDTRLKEAAKLMASKWIRHLPVCEGTNVVGIISQRDLTGVLAGALNEPEALHQLLESSQLVRERRLKRIEAGDLD